MLTLRSQFAALGVRSLLAILVAARVALPHSIHAEDSPAWFTEGDIEIRFDREGGSADDLLKGSFKAAVSVSGVAYAFDSPAVRFACVYSFDDRKARYWDNGRAFDLQYPREFLPGHMALSTPHYQDALLARIRAAETHTLEEVKVDEEQRSIIALAKSGPIPGQRLRHEFQLKNDRCWLVEIDTVLTESGESIKIGTTEAALGERGDIRKVESTLLYTDEMTIRTNATVRTDRNTGGSLADLNALGALWSEGLQEVAPGPQPGPGRERPRANSSPGPATPGGVPPWWVSNWFRAALAAISVILLLLAFKKRLRG